MPMHDEDDICGQVEHRGKKQLYVADFDTDTREDLVHLRPVNFEYRRSTVIKKMPGTDYEGTAKWRIREIVREIESST